MNYQSNESNNNLPLNDYKVVVLGMASVGKSSVTIRYVNNMFSADYNPTLQDTFRKNFILDNKPGCLEILDTAGQEEYIVMQDHWIREGKSFIIVYSITNSESFSEVERIRKRIERVRNSKDVPMVIIGNKCDLENQRKVSKEELEALAQQFNCNFFETSAKEGTNCVETFMEVVREMRKREVKPKIKKQEKNPFKEFFKKNCNLI